MESSKKQFEIDAGGAYVRFLNDENGQPIFAPLTRLGPDQKKRGGCHVCLPYFGADVSGRPQHGFARDLEWRIEEREDGSVSAFFDTDVPLWEGFRAQIEYTAGERQFAMELKVFNGSTEARRVSPGFHPYFALEGNDFELDGRRLKANEFGEAQFIEGSSHHFETSTHTLILHSDELQTWALWSDRLGDYFCIEPTFRGPSQEAGTEPLDGEQLLPGEERSYRFTIRW